MCTDGPNFHPSGRTIGPAMKIADRLGIEAGTFRTVPCFHLALFGHRNGPPMGRADGYRLDFRQPAALASASVQNHRSPREVSIRVFA